MKKILLTLGSALGLQFSVFADLPTEGKTIHLAAAGAIVSQDNQVTALNDQGSLKLRAFPRKGKDYGGILQKSALNGHDTIKSRGFTIDGKKAGALNASKKGVSIVLVAKVTANHYNNIVRKRETSDDKSTDVGYLVAFDPNQNAFMFSARSSAKNSCISRLPVSRDWFVLVMSVDVPANRLDTTFNGKKVAPLRIPRSSKLGSLSNKAPFEIGSMEFAELAVYDRPLTAAEQNEISAALAAKYDISAK